MKNLMLFCQKNVSLPKFCTNYVPINFHPHKNALLAISQHVTYQCTIAYNVYSFLGKGGVV